MSIVKAIEEMSFPYLPTEIVDNIFQHLNIKSARIAKDVTKQFNNASFVFDKEQFTTLLSNLIKTYNLMYIYFIAHPIGYGMGYKIELSILIDERVVFTMWNDHDYVFEKVSNLLIKDVDISSIEKGVRIKVTFIHDTQYKNTWVSHAVDLINRVDEVELAKSILIDSKKGDEEFIKFIVACILISKFKSVFITKIENNKVEIQEIEKYPNVLSSNDVTKIKNSRANFKKLMGANFLLNDYKPINDIENKIINIKSFVNFEALENITNINKDKLKTLPERDDNDKAQALDRKKIYEDFFNSIIEFTQFMNNITTKSGGKNKKKTKQIYVKTDKRFGRRIIYTRGGKDFIREKKNGEYGYKRI